ncbi:MAG: DUF2066 domain-containing protein [Alphaproteobacteria bacterium]|nr:DUF2066 domain-containing protein [Alphaproteobacteria bacterium]
MLRFIFVFVLFLLAPLNGVGSAWAASTSPLPTIGSTNTAAAKPVVKAAASPAAVSKIEPAAKAEPTPEPKESGEVSSDDPYTVHGVQVDVTAENSMKARDKAFTLGQQTAFLALAKTMSGEDKIKMYDEAQIGKLVKSFEVETERASGTRYTATLTYHFKPQATSALLGKNGVEVSDDPYNRPKKRDGIEALSATTMPPERILVLPILRAPERSILWEEKTSWHRAWDNVLSDRPQPDLMIAEGTLEDVGAITASEALAGLNLPLTRIMRKYQAHGVIVPVLMASSNMPQPNQNLSIQLARFDDHGKMLGTIVLPVPAQPNRKDMEWLQASVMNTINAWRDNVAKTSQQPIVTTQSSPINSPASGNMPAPAAGQFMRVMLTVPFANMEEWASKREALQGIPGMAALEVLRMNRYRAVVQLDYTGAQSQLDQALTTRNMQILPTNPPDGTYMLSSTGQPQVVNGATGQPVFKTVYPPTQPGQIQPAQIQPVGQPELIPEQPVQEPAAQDPNSDERFQ